MKKILILLFITVAVSQVSACRLLKKKHKASGAEITATASDEKKTGIVVVSFISFGAGIDFKALPEFEQFMKVYNTRSSCGFRYEVKNWGREGERDYCFTSNGQQCFTDFITSLKNKYKGNDRILIKENEPCRP